MLLTVNEIQDKVNLLGSIINIPSKDLHIYPSPPGDGTPHIAIEGDSYNYVYSERGIEFCRRTTSSLDELLYWIMFDFIHKIAVRYELKNRVPYHDGRRIIFPMIIDLMAKINPEWGIRVKNEINNTLQNSPYDDTTY